MVPAPESPPPGAARHNLPIARTGLIGRERECAVVAQALTAAPLVTLTGVGGGGKTRLALAVAADEVPHFPDGCWLVELAAIDEPGLIPAAVALALGLQLPQGGEQGTGPEATLLAYLRPRALLLVLDNCEHLIEDCAAFAARALAAAPGLRILATSREPLRIGGEQQYRLAPLAAPDPAALPPLADLGRNAAVRLFVARAQAADLAFRLTPENAAAVAGICARLDGIPLALELAAARVGVLGLGEILDRLNDSVRLLTGGNRAGPTRQQTLRAALAWGDTLLTPAERALFRRLAVFAGGWDLAAAEAVGTAGEVDRGAVLDLLARLVDKSLVLAETGPGTARYRLLEPVRQFAATLLAAQREGDAARARHAAAYLALAERAAIALRGPAQVRWLARLGHEVGNLRAALAWAAERGAAGDPVPGLRLATALVPFWEARSDLIEGRERLATALAAPPVGEDDAALRVRARLGAGRLAYLQGEYAVAAALQAAALEQARARADSGLIAAAVGELGMVRRLQRDLAGATRAEEEALARFRALDDRPGIAFALLNLGATARVAGDAARAATLLAESLALYQAEGDLRNIAIARSMLGLTAAQQGDQALAAGHLATSLAAHRDLADRRFIIFDLIGLAGVLFAQGRRGEAARLLGAAEALGELAGTDLAKVGRVTYAPFLAEARACLGQTAFAAAWAEGRALPPERAIDYALASAGAGQPDTPAPRPAAETLTRREREVALLVARGQSDRAIAAALSISPATASLHVHRILEKLALRSRHQVADWIATQDTPTHPPG